MFLCFLNIWHACWLTLCLRLAFVSTCPVNFKRHKNLDLHDLVLCMWVAVDDDQGFPRLDWIKGKSSSGTGDLTQNSVTAREAAAAVDE
jgi:hypothetical protein